jgi:hypothetical protein
MRRIIMALAVLALPSAALAQTPEQRIESAMARASAAGIPVSLLETKVADGKAKGVPMDRIAAAVERRATALEQARAAFTRAGQSPSEQELDVSADALGVGVSEAVLLRLSETSGGERRAAAIAALTQLVAMGEVPQQALDQVMAALARGGDALSRLPEEAAAARERRGPPAGVGRAGARPANAGPPAGVPAPGQAPAQRRPPLGIPIGG